MRGATGQRGEMANLKAETERESAELARRKVNTIVKKCLHTARHFFIYTKRFVF